MRPETRPDHAAITAGGLIRSLSARRGYFLPLLTPAPGALIAAIVLLAAPSEARAQIPNHDTDAAGLLEVTSLAQVHAMGYDRGGRRTYQYAAYLAAFPHIASSCPNGGCTGYEPAANLDFDTDGSGEIDAGEDYWNDGAGWEPISSFNATFAGNGYTISNLYVNRSGSQAGFHPAVAVGFFNDDQWSSRHNVHDDYWDVDTSGVGSGSGTGKTTSALQFPTSATGIYANWNEETWDLGTSTDYPVLRENRETGEVTGAVTDGLTGAVGAATGAANSPASGAPVISGTAQAGETLTADTSGIADANGLTDVAFSYDWWSDGGARSHIVLDPTNFELAPGHVNEVFFVRVGFVDDAGYTEWLTSEEVDPVAPPPDTPPTVSDTSHFRKHDATVGEAFSLPLPEADAGSGNGEPLRIPAVAPRPEPELHGSGHQRLAFRHGDADAGGNAGGGGRVAAQLRDSRRRRQSRRRGPLPRSHQFAGNGFGRITDGNTQRQRR